MKGMDELRNRFETLEPRERLFVMIAAGFIVLALLFFAIVQPLLQYREGAEDRVASQRELVSWMRGAVEVLRERGPGAGAAVDTSGSLLAVTDTSARSAGLANALRRIQQQGDDAVRVRLESASFDSIILWLETLRNSYGVTANEMTVDRADGPGLVNASLTLTRNVSS